MAELGDFYGVSLEYKNTESLYRGVSLEYSENLIIRFLDSFGDVIDDLDELEINDGTTVVTLTNVGGGSYSMIVEDETVFIIKATNDGKFASDSLVHEGGDQYLVITLQLLTPPCIDERTKTPFNFYHWHRVNNILLTDFGAGDFSPCNKTYPEWLPNIFNKQDINCHFPILVEEETIALQLNFDEETNIDFDNCTLAIVHNYEIKLDAITSLVINTDNGINTVYFEYTHPKNILTGDQYQFMIYSSSDGYVKLLSNQFSILPKNTEFLNQSVYIEYRNSSDYDYFKYDTLSSFYTKVRLQINTIKYDFEYDRKEAKEFSTGKTRSQKVDRRKFVELEPYFFDQYSHDALASLSDHDDIKINGEVVKIKAGFETDTKRDMKVSKGSISFYLEKYSTANYKN